MNNQNKDINERIILIENNLKWMKSVLVGGLGVIFSCLILFFGVTYKSIKQKIDQHLEKSTIQKAEKIIFQKKDSSVVAFNDIVSLREKSDSLFQNFRNSEDILDYKSIKIGTHNLSNSNRDKHFSSNNLLIEGQRHDFKNQIEWRNLDGTTGSVFNLNSEYAVWAYSTVASTANEITFHQNKAKYLGSLAPNKTHKNISLGINNTIGGFGIQLEANLLFYLLQ